jgi:8-oxo-dGTP pyrophosphatase MutT (NUDIX family)
MRRAHAGRAASARIKIRSIMHSIPPSRLTPLYDILRARASEPPPDQALPLDLAGHRCGWITRAAQDALREAGLILPEDGIVRLLPDQSPGPELDAALAQVAQVLREAGCLRGWRDELLDIRADGEWLGVIERTAMRPLGLLTRAVHLNAWTPDGRLWVARRALDKATDPGMWDTLVGGLVSSGENLDLALVRECGEEAGLDAPDLQNRSPLRTTLRLHRRLPEGYQVEDLLASRCVLEPGVQPVNRDGEVMEIAAMPMDDVVGLLEADEFTLEAALVIVEDLLRAG